MTRLKTDQKGKKSQVKVNRSGSNNDVESCDYKFVALDDTSSNDLRRGILTDYESDLLAIDHDSEQYIEEPKKSLHSFKYGALLFPLH